MEEDRAKRVSTMREKIVRRLGYDPNEIRDHYEVKPPVPDATGKKSDSEKLRYDLESPYAREFMIRVLTHGAAKYGDRNWENGIAWTRIIAAVQRHLAAILKGEMMDPESCFPHSAHAACGIHFLQHYEIFRQEFNDIPSLVPGGSTR